jgi:hypothetical protein
MVNGTPENVNNLKVTEPQGLEDFEIYVVELEDENGNKEEFAILEELEFEGTKFVVGTLLSELQNMPEEGEGDLSIEVFVVDGENYTILADEDQANRLLAHLEAKEKEEQN